MSGEIESKVKSCFSLMEDEPSRVIYTAQVYYNLTGDYAYIGKMLRTLYSEHRGCFSSQKLLETLERCSDELESLKPLKSFTVDHDNMFFEPSLISLGEDEVFVDCGAMDMSTSLEFAYNCRDTFKRIVAFEPDPVCLEICRDNLQFFSKDKRDSVKLFECGVSDHSGDAPFERSSEAGCSRIVAKSDEVIRARRLDDVEDCAEATFIKLHIEGGELAAVIGASELIKKNKPTVAVSCYHNISELLNIPLILKQLAPSYKLFMRHYSTGTAESVLYAVDEARLPERSVNTIGNN